MGEGETPGVNLLPAIQAGLFCLPFSPGATRPQASVITDHPVTDSVCWGANALLLGKHGGLRTLSPQWQPRGKGCGNAFCYFVSSRRRLMQSHGVVPPARLHLGFQDRDFRAVLWGRPSPRPCFPCHLQRDFHRARALFLSGQRRSCASEHLPGRGPSSPLGSLPSQPFLSWTSDAQRGVPQRRHGVGTETHPWQGHGSRIHSLQRVWFSLSEVGLKHFYLHLKKSCPGRCGSVGWSVVQYTEGFRVLRVRFPVWGHT